MLGKVRFFNVVKGVGFIDVVVEGKKREHFVHFSSIDEGDKFEFLLAGDQVEFTPVPDPQPSGLVRWQAKHVTIVDRDQSTRVRVNPDAESPFLVGRIASLAVEGDRLELLGKGNHVASPYIEAEGNFRVYNMGETYVSEFAFDLPESTPDEAIVLLDPESKNPRRPVERAEGEMDVGNFYLDVVKGSYLLRVKRSGHVSVECVGNVYYRNTKTNYLVIQRRFAHRCKFSDVETGENLEQALLRQIPISGLDRDNDGFVRGILRGIQMMNAAKVSAETQATAS